MKKILCLALPAMLAASCGDSAGPIRAQPMDAAPDVDVADTLPKGPDVPVKLDLYVAPNPDVDLTPIPLDAGYDTPILADLVAGPVDVPPAVDGPSPIDAPAIDGPAHPIDGPARPTDAETRTLYSPDGRTWTVVMVAACLFGAKPNTTSCPVTYSEGLAKVLGVDGGSYFSETRAGRCVEGSYVYFPYFGTSSIGCYYDATSQSLVASAQHEDTIIECGDGTASHTMAYGSYPPCTQITWEARSPL
jgi:hypothetical protein